MKTKIIDISKLTLAQKIELMEALWKDISSNNYESPEWHKEILDERMKSFENGNAELYDLKEVKERIRKRINVNKNS